MGRLRRGLLLEARDAKFLWEGGIAIDCALERFLRQQCNKLKPRVLVIEICSITGSAMMEAGDIADATIDVANVDYKKGIMTPDGTRRPWRRVGCIREVCFEKLIDECEATMGKGESYDAVFFLVTTSCRSSNICDVMCILNYD